MLGIVARPGISPVMPDKPGGRLVPELVASPAELPPGRAEVISLAPLDEVQGAPSAPASAEASGPERGSPGRSHSEPPAADPPVPWVAPLSEDVGRSVRDTVCANAGAATPTVRMLAVATPPSRIRQLYTKYSTSFG